MTPSAPVARCNIACSPRQARASMRSGKLVSPTDGSSLAVHIRALPTPRYLARSRPRWLFTTSQLSTMPRSVPPSLRCAHAPPEFSTSPASRYRRSARALSTPNQRSGLACSFAWLATRVGEHFEVIAAATWPNTLEDVPGPCSRIEPAQTAVRIGFRSARGSVFHPSPPPRSSTAAASLARSARGPLGGWAAGGRRPTSLAVSPPTPGVDGSTPGGAVQG